VRPLARLVVAAPLAVSWVVPLGTTPAAAQEVVTPELIQVIDTSQLSPPSPDPSGLAVTPSGTLLFTDGEVEELPTLYRGRNAFEITTSGTLVDSFRTTRFSDEPVGVAVKRRTVFISDDDKDMVFRLRPGPDGRYGTRDDKVTSFRTRPFGSTDPEGLAFGMGALFIADGRDATVYRVGRGRNGVFDGVAPEGDDRVRSFGVSAFGQLDPEGIEFNPETGTLFVVSNQRGSNAIEVTTGGDLVREIDLSTIGIRSPAGLAYGPRRTDPSRYSLYVADRGRDNGGDPLENDGKIYELALP